MFHCGKNHFTEIMDNYVRQLYRKERHYKNNWRDFFQKNAFLPLNKNQ